MLGHVAAFELKYQLRSPMFWGTTLVFFVLAFAATVSDDLRLGWGGQVYRNAPFAIATGMMVMTLLAMFIVTAFVANVVLRDDETGFGPIIQATPLSKFNYLFGRFAGGYLAAALAFVAVPLGALAAIFWPGIDADTLGPVQPGDYVYIYALFCLPTLFLLGAFFFALATATRSIVTTYVGALILLATYLFTSLYLRRPEFGAASTLTDPFGIASFNFATKNWTAYDRNTILPPFFGLVAENRAIWLAVALAFLALAWRSFTRKGFQTRADRRSARNEDRVIDAPAAPAISAALARPPHRALGWGPLAALTRFELLGVFRSPAFVALLGFAFVNTVVGLWLAGDDTVALIYPVTRIMIQTLAEQFTTVPLFIAAFYAGELMWRDRERRMHEIVDATPSPDWAFLAPKILAIALLLLTMGLMSIVAAIGVQLLKGFTTIEVVHYFTWYLAPWFVTMMLYAVLAVFVQTLVPHKFVGLLVILIYYILGNALPTMGFESHLYLYATTSPVPFSDMDGLGRFAGFAAWYQAYWAACAVILTVLAYGLWRRGASAPLPVRIRKLPARFRGAPGVIAAIAAGAMASLGGWIYYNNYILNSFPTYNESQRWSAAYEKTLLPYEADAQPRIVDVKLDVDLYPDRPQVVTRGTYVVENKTGAPLDRIYVSWLHSQVQKIFLGTIAYPGLQMRSLDVQGAKLTRELPEYNFRIYTFDRPMAPGERREIRFASVREQRGFRNSGNENRIVANGTFLDNWLITPWLGVPRYPFLKDRATRRKYGLVPELQLSTLEDGKGRAFNYFRHDSDYVNSDITLTGPADQTLLAAGHQVSRQVKGDRQTVRFQSESPILNFFSIQAGKYAVEKSRWKDVGVEIYYHPAHAYNVKRMNSIVMDALDYYTANFSPYQFQQFRIVEFPAYNNFAQSFPGTVPYSEAAGFVMKVDERQGIDFITYATAHEFGHQWWAHQIIGGDQEGSTVLTETLAQYSAIMVMEKRYGPAMIRRFLKHGLDNYLTDRGKENVAEPTLERVQEQAYVRYDKGGLVMYLLKERLGEARVNRALRSLIQRYAFKGAPYPTSRDLEAALRAEAAPDQQQLITDLFRHITLYDFKVVDARTTARPDGRWNLTMTVAGHKRYADGKGKEREAPLDEVVDMGAFAADPNAAAFHQADVISLGARRVTTGVQTITLIVPRRPQFVGIDPYLKYIDRTWEDNVRKID